MKKYLFTFLLGLIATYSWSQNCSALFSYTQSSGNTFSFAEQASGPGMITNYVWNFGDGNQSSQPNPTHTYSTPGWYNACLTIYGVDSNNTTFTCNYCDSVYAQSPNQFCQASFVANNTVGNTVAFTNTAIFPGTISSYSWNFGNGATSTQANPTYTYPTSGNYNVCLVIAGYNAMQQFIQCYWCDSIVVGQPAGPCSALFNYTQSGSSTFNFAEQASGPGTITNYVWNFGDGNQSSQPNPTHTYASTGWYNACLTIYGVDSNNNTFTCTYCDSLYAQSNNTPCLADFNYLVSGNLVSFNGYGTGPGVVTSYSWTFGDGGTSTLQNPVHIYSTAGFYTVCLTVSGVDSNNQTFSCTYCDMVYTSVIGNPCNAIFTYMQSSGSTFNFTSLATGPGTITNYNWTFGDGGTSTQMNPTHTYTSTGLYNVCLTVVGIDSNNISFTCTYCDSTIYAQASSGPCSANFSYMQSSGNTFNFTSLASGPGTIVSYNWTFGNGGTSTQMNPTYSYSTSGWYNVCLTVVGIDSMNQTFTCTYCDSVFAQAGSTLCNITAGFTKTKVGNTVNFSNTTNCTGCTGINYVWTFGDGGTSTQTNPSHTYATSGTYTVCLKSIGLVQNNTGCIDSICTTVIVGSSGLNDFNNHSLQVYPNPTKDHIEIVLPEQKAYQLKVMDIAGQTLFDQSIKSKTNTYQLSMNTMANGIYFVILQDDEKRYQTRILKQ